MPSSSEFKQVLDRIYQDNPSYWPHGLNRGQLDEAYLIRDPATKQSAGFVGWQVRRDDTGKRAAYYAVGILPEFRRQGLAKRALQEMFREHRPADVQDIRAFIVPGNEPSTQLAQQLGVQIQHKQAALRLVKQPAMLGKMARSTAYVPNHYSGLSLQQYMPLAPRRDNLNPAEQVAVQEGSSQWFPTIFKSMADSPAADMSSPGKGAIMAALAGGGVGAGAAHLLNASPTHTALAGGGAGLLSGLLAYLHRKAQNSSTEEMMKRLPVNGTRRDMLADPVIQQEMNRDSQTGASEEALRTAQLLAVLQATSKQAAVKRSAWWHPLLTASKYMAAPVAGAVGMDALYNAPSGRFATTEHWKERLADGLLNTTMFGIGKGTGRLPGVSALAKAESALARGAKQPSKLLSLQQNVEAAKRLQTMGGATGMAVAIPGVFAKDLMRRNMNTGSDLVSALNKPAPPPQPTFFDQASNWAAQNPGTALAGGVAGAGVLAGAGYLAHRATQALQGVADRAQQPESGRIRVTLPTKNKGDAETQIDMPVQQLDMSDALFGKIRRDFRSRLRTETNARTRKVELSEAERQRRAALLASYR